MVELFVGGKVHRGATIVNRAVDGRSLLKMPLVVGAAEVDVVERNKEGLQRFAMNRMHEGAETLRMIDGFALIGGRKTAVVCEDVRKWE